MPESDTDQRPVTQADLHALVRLLEYHQGGLTGLLTMIIKVQLVSLLVLGLLLGVGLVLR